jgi:hypothetical protein
VSFYVSTAIYFLVHCDEWDCFVTPPRHKFVTGATLLQLLVLEQISILCHNGTIFDKPQEKTGLAIKRHVGVLVAAIM